MLVDLTTGEYYEVRNFINKDDKKGLGGKIFFEKEYYSHQYHGMRDHHIHIFKSMFGNISIDEDHVLEPEILYSSSAGIRIYVFRKKKEGRYVIFESKCRLDDHHKADKTEKFHKEIIKEKRNEDVSTSTLTKRVKRRRDV